MLKSKNFERGIASIYIVLIIIAILVIGIGAFVTVNYFINSKSDNKITNNEQTKENVGEKNTLDENGLAYKFSIDSKNKRVYDVKPFDGTDLYKVQLNGVKNTYYVMDTSGNTIFKVLEYVDTTDDYKYIYTYNDNTIKIYNAITHEEITPKGINDKFSSKEFFIEGDIICTYSASYDLTNGKCLWNGEKMNVKTIGYKANGLMLCLDSNQNYIVYNYLTGKNLCKGIEKTYLGCQINSAGYYILQIGNVIKVHNANGEFLNEFNVPSKHKIAQFVMPGKHFCFYEDKNSPYQVTVTDMSGKIVREDVYIRTWSDTYYYYPKKDTIMVHGDLTNRNKDWYSGVLDSSMNWVISQSDKLYSKITWVYGDIYYLRDNNSNYYLYNSSTKAKLNMDKSIYLIKYDTEDNKIIEIAEKMYKADTLELINIDYKKNYQYCQLSKNTFLEYDKNNPQDITIYDENGKVVTKVKLDEGSKYTNALNNTIITYNKNTGYSLVKIDI